MTDTGHKLAEKYNLQKTSCGAISPKGDVCARVAYHPGDHIPRSSDYKKRDTKRSWPQVFEEVDDD